MTKSKWSAALLLIAAFVLGGLTGGAAVAAADRGAVEARRPRGGMVERLAERLDLSAAQQDSVRAILERHHAAFQADRDEVGADIRAVLTDDHLERYEAMKSEMKTHRHRQGAAAQPPTQKAEGNDE